MFSKETLARGAVNAMPLVRAVAGPLIGEKIRKTPPEQRSKKMALAVGAIAATDFWDGFFAKRYLGTTRFGSWADKIGDKIFDREIERALTDTGEIPGYHHRANMARDIAVTGLRIYAEARGMDTEASPMARAKTLIGMCTKVAAASPLAENNALINAGMVTTTALSIATGVDYVRQFAGGRN